MNVDTLGRNVNLARMTGEDGYGELRNGAIAVRNGRIEWIGPDSEIPADLEPAEEYDFGGAWLTPGLIDCHTHLVWAGNRSSEFEQRMSGRTYAEIATSGGGIVSTVRATRDATEESLVANAQIRADALSREGVTTIEVKSGYGLNLESELKMLRAARKIRGVRITTTFLGAHCVPPEYLGRADEYVELICESMLPAIAAAGLADAVDAFCESVAFSPSQTRRVLEAAIGLGFRVKLHADQLSDSGGAGLIAELGGLSADHVEYTSEASVRAMARAGTSAVLLPGAFYMLRESQKPPVDLFRQHGVPMAVATDCNPGTSPCTSLTLMMNMACVLFGLTPSEALAGVTRNAARALGLQHDRGQLKVGMSADFALFDIDHPRDLAAAIGMNSCTQTFVGT